MRRRIQAVARGQGRCDCGPIGIRLSRNGRPGSAVGPSGGEETPQIAARIKGPLHQRNIRVVGETQIVDTFGIFMHGAEESDSFQWVGPANPDGTTYDIPDTTVEFADSTAAATDLVVTYPLVGGESSSVEFGCFVNGFLFFGNVEIGPEYGA